jgi:acetyl esterase/lipase
VRWVDITDEKSSQPDFANLLYPGKFLPKRRPEETDLKLAPWIKISADAPPTLLIHAMNDSTNTVQNSMAYALALNNVGVPVDMHLFAKGCHAFGLRATPDPITTEWPRMVIKWLHNNKVL